MGDIIVTNPIATWGRPDAVRRACWEALPEPMRREGALMLLDMGLPPLDACARLGLCLDDLSLLLHARMAPWQRPLPDFDVPGGRG